MSQILDTSRFIERNPLKCFSMPSLIGRRLTVFDIVTQINGENDIDTAIETYEIDTQSAHAALSYCSALHCLKDGDKFQYCDGCSLRAKVDNDKFDPNDYYQIIENGISIITSRKDRSIFLGSMQELETEVKGKNTWLIASNLLKRYFPDSQ